MKYEAVVSILATNFVRLNTAWALIFKWLVCILNFGQICTYKGNLMNLIFFDTDGRQYKPKCYTLWEFFRLVWYLFKGVPSNLTKSVVSSSLNKGEKFAVLSGCLEFEGKTRWSTRVLLVLPLDYSPSHSMTKKIRFKTLTRYGVFKRYLSRNVPWLS